LLRHNLTRHRSGVGADLRRQGSSSGRRQSTHGAAWARTSGRPRCGTRQGVESRLAQYALRREAMHFCISSLLECKLPFCFSSSVGPWNDEAQCKTDLHASLALCIAKIVSNRAGKPPTEHCATPLSARHPSSQQLPPDRRNKSAQGLLRGGERVEQGARRRTGEARRRAGERGRGARA
jgi:hypothetical protein